MFTEQQIANWRKYERTRASGEWNMFDPRARQATGLTSENYDFVRKNYAALRIQVLAELDLKKESK
jgi:hypothetical protein